MEMMDQSFKNRLEVMMITEGTYPFHWGGVSTWCHLLLRDLPNIDFSLLSLVGDPSTAPQFALPSNVIDYRPTPLWGIREVLEDRTDLTAAELMARRKRTTENVIRTRFIPHLRFFLEDIFSVAGDAHQMGQSVHAMHRFFLDYDFDTAWRSRAAWRCFVEVAQDGFPPAAAHHGYPGARYQLSDLTTCLQWLYHWFFPIGRPLPKVDVAHAAMVGICSLIAVAAKYEHGAAFMLTEHGIYLRERYLAEATSSQSLFQKLFTLRFARRMTELSYALADMIAPCCDYNQRWERRSGASSEQIQTIYYGVDAEVFSPEHKPFGDPPVVAWVGRIDPLKDLFTLLQAAAVVHQSRPDIEFRLFGSAPAGNEAYYQRCLDLREELGLEEAVVFAGYRANTAAAFNEGDVVVLSSVSEAFPFAILEAMLCEKPVVATAVGGVPEQIAGCGLAVEPRNPAAMAEAILKLMDDPELARELGQAARIKATQEYSVRQSGLAHETAYRRLANRTSGVAGLHPAGDAHGEPDRTAHVHSTEDGAVELAPVAADVVAAGSAVAVQRVGVHNGTEGRSRDLIQGQLYSAVTAGHEHNGFHNGRHGPAAGRLHSGLAAGAGNGASVNGHNDGAAIDGPGMAAATQHPGGVVAKSGNGSFHANGNGVHANGNGVHANGNGVHANGNGVHANGDGVHSLSPEVSAIGWAIQSAAVANLAAEIAHRDVEPIDALEITALMESMGITDEVAAQRYGAPDTFDLGHAVLEYMRTHGLPARTPEELPALTVTWKERLTDYARGPLALVPPVLLLTVIAAFSVFGDWDHRQIMLLSVGITSSLLITNGFIQAISRRTSFYLGLRKATMARRYYGLSTSVVTVAIIGGALLVTLGATWLGLYAGGGQGIFVLSFAGLTTIWMASGGLPLVQRTAWLSFALAAGIGVGVAVHLAMLTRSQHHLALGALAGYITTILIVLDGLRRGFAAAQHGSTARRTRLPSVAYMAQEAAPYFGYGFIYMILILLPHVIGWLGALPAGLERMSAVSNVELGLTLSMPPLILAYGVADHAMRLFWRRAAVEQVRTPGADVAGFGASLREFCDRQRVIYVLVLTVLTVAAYLVFRMAVQAGWFVRWLQLTDTSDLSLIFAASLVAYWLLGVGLFNSMFLVTLGSPQAATQAILWGTLAMVVVGVHLASIHYAYVAVAFVLAAFVFVLASWGKNDLLLQSADHHYASAL